MLQYSTHGDSNLLEGTGDGRGGDNLTTLNPGSSERPRTNTFRKTRNVTVKLLIFKKIKQSWGCGGLACSVSKSPGLDNQLV